MRPGEGAREIEEEEMKNLVRGIWLVCEMFRQKADSSGASIASGTAAR